MIQFITCCRSTVGVSSGECGCGGGIANVPRPPLRAVPPAGSVRPSACGEMSSCTCLSSSISAAVSDAEVGRPSRLGGADVPPVIALGRLLSPRSSAELEGIFTERFRLGRHPATSAAFAAVVAVPGKVTADPGKPRVCCEPPDAVPAFAARLRSPPPCDEDGSVVASRRLRLPEDSPAPPPASRSSSFFTSTACLFFTALSVLPPTIFAISVHLFPCCLCPFHRISSSSGLQPPCFKSLFR